MYNFDKELDELLTKRGLSDDEKQLFLDNIVSVRSSAQGRVKGIENNIAAMRREGEQAQKELDAAAALIDKVAIEMPEPVAEAAG